MSKRLLIVDDAVIMRMRIREIAREAGWTVVGEAANGQEAIARFRELTPDLVTLDIVMPVKDGVTALREIRQEYPGARIIMVSAVDQREKLLECIRLGALDFVVKPFNKASLTDVLSRVATESPPSPPLSTSA
ncbi:MAG: response regulator [Planctomycetaceae bacterium]|jgi:two-component system chemotaxis response regulator CheY